MIEEALTLLNAPRRLKRELPIPWVLEQEGIRMELQGRQLAARCPFHPDSDPSLYITDEGERGWRWGCWPCGLSGDVLDLMTRLYGIRFTDAVAAGLRGVEKIKATGWVAPVLEGAEPFNGAAARALLSQARVQTANQGGLGVDYFLRSKGIPVPADWLMRTWGVEALDGHLLVPVYDTSRTLVGVKHRRCDGSDHLFAFPGSELQGVLYGEDRLKGEFPGDPGPVVLCEGESDAWLASWLIRDTPYNVLGLATGAGSPVRPASRLAGRDVHIVFDGDEAGRAGGVRWETELRRHGCAVTRWALPEGEDVCSLGHLNFLPR